MKTEIYLKNNLFNGHLFIFVFIVLSEFKHPTIESYFSLRSCFALERDLKYFGGDTAKQMKKSGKKNRSLIKSMLGISKSLEIQGVGLGRDLLMIKSA